MSIVAAWALLQMYGETAQAASWGAMGGTLGTLAGAVASFLFMTVILLRRLPEIRLRARRDRTGQEESWGLIARALILTILPIVFSQTIYQISYTLDDLLFSRFMNAAGMAENAITSVQGVFNTQYNQMVNLPVSIATAMAMTLMPSIVASYVKRERREVRNKITSTVKFNMAIAFPCAVGLAVLARPMMSILFPMLGIIMRWRRIFWRPDHRRRCFMRCPPLRHPSCRAPTIWPFRCSIRPWRCASI